MKKKRREKWHLNPEEVTEFVTGHSGGFNRKKLRYSRNSSETELKIELTHEPTGIKVSKVIKGYYSRNQVKKLKETYYIELFALLEEKVAKHLRIPGRCKL